MRNFIDTDGHQAWYLNGMRHREDGPAFVGADGSQAWWLNGDLHRTDGPAIIWEDGVKRWYLNGLQTSFEEYVNQLFPEDSPERSLFLLKYSD